MPTLTLLRHGIAEDKLITTHPDILRPLTPNWRKKLLKTLEANQEQLQSIDYILCSRATRARQTCNMLTSVIDFDTEQILYSQDIYDLSGWYHGLWNLIQAIPSDKKHICLVGHNNSISALARYLTWKDVHLKKWILLTITI